MFSVSRLSSFCVFSAALLLISKTDLFSGAAQHPTGTQPQSNTQLIHSLDGRDLYRAYCASCHGINAHGDGPAAPALKGKVPDLTVISGQNRGNFPANRVKRIISDEETPIAHGSREMPIWGPIFHEVEADQDWGNVRLQNLTQYLQSIQKK